MPEIDEKPDLRQAAEELQRYLSDEIAPMMVVEYFEALAPHPPEFTAKIIAQWIASQNNRPTENVATGDLIFHALKKLSLLSELELVRRATIIRAIHEISRMLLRVCPEAQRDELRLRLSHLGQTATVLASRAEFLHREAGATEQTEAKPAGPKPAGPKPDPETMDRGARALSLLLGGLAKLRNPKAPPEKEGPQAAMLAQILSTAALESKTNDDLARHLERVKKEGVATPMGRCSARWGGACRAGGRSARRGRPSTRARGGSFRRWTGSSRWHPTRGSGPSDGER